jgi:RHS repeat-associated protein
MPGTPQEQYTRFEYEENAFMPKKVTDPIGRKTAFSYDTMGNVTSVTRLAETPDAVTTNYTYSSDFNQLTSFTDPLQHRATLNYDTRGNLTEIKNALNHTTALEHDSQGRVTKITDALNHSVTLTYLGPDLVTITDALGRSYQMTYDAIGRIRAVDDPAGNRTRYNYDLVGGLKEVVDASGKSVSFDYDSDGNMIASTDQRSKTTRYEYDVLNRLSSRTDPLGRQETFTYANNGKLEKVTDRKGQISLRRYDVVGNLYWIGIGATVAAPDAYESTIELHYDLANRLTSVVDSANGTISYEYDGLDRLKKETTQSGVVQYDYDAASRPTLTTPPAGQAPIEYAFDSANRLQEIRSAGDVVHFTFDNANQPMRVQLRTGLVTDYEYDEARQLKGINYSSAAGPIGNLSYDYDSLGRVIHLGGSLVGLNLPAAMSGAVYNDHNQLITWNGASYSYDENGNLSADGTRSFTWNARDELVQISGGSTSAQFSYDAWGRRTRKSVNSAATKYVYDGPNIVQERSDDGSLRASFLPGFGMDEMYGRTRDSAKTEYLTDSLGSTIAIADASGTLLTNYTYEPHGKAVQGGAADDNSRAFTGREDDRTGLLYYRARYYDPSTARFIAEDPLGLGGGDFNLYRYVLGDPINHVDPSGLIILVPYTDYQALALREQLKCNQGSTWGCIKAAYYWFGDFFGLMGPQGAVDTIMPMPCFSNGLSAAGRALLSAKPVGSALKSDAFHMAATFMRERAAYFGEKFEVTGADGVTRTLTQYSGGVNGQAGRFDYLVDPSGNLVHQRFLPGGAINGIPNRP